MIEAGKLNRKITFQAETITRNALNEGVPVFVTICTKWAAIQELGSKELYTAQKSFAETSAVFKIRYTQRINSKMRIVIGNRVFQIISLTPDRSLTELNIAAKEVTLLNIEEALTAYVLAQSSITALIGNRFAFDVLPIGTGYPAIICQVISDVKIHTHQGQAPVEEPKYQFTAYAMTRAAARALAEQVKTAFCDYRGTMSGLTIQYITLLNELPDTLTNADGTIKLHAVALEFEIIYNKE